MQVEGAADARVGDHRGEDLRAVDLLALTGADCYNLIFHMDDDNLGRKLFTCHEHFLSM